MRVHMSVALTHADFPFIIIAVAPYDFVHMQLLEIVLPVFFVYILLLIKGAVEDNEDFTASTVEAVIPDNELAFTPVTFQDYVTALQGQRFCELQLDIREAIASRQPPKLKLGITGVPARGYDWQIPLVKCDSRKCQTEGEPADDYCEHSIIAVTAAGSNTAEERARDFIDWMFERYPDVTDPDKMPFDPLTRPLVQWFDSSAAMNDYVKRSDYGSLTVPKIALGIVWRYVRKPV